MTDRPIDQPIREDPVEAAVNALDAAVAELRRALAEKKLRDAQEGT